MHSIDRAERFLCGFCRDEFIWSVAKLVAENFQVPLGTNLVSHYFATVGLANWVPVDQEVGQFAYGGMIGVHRTNVLQHDRAVYARISTSVTQFRWTGVLLERCWLMLFGGAAIADNLL